jgi:signal transduction histidine kinase
MFLRITLPSLLLSVLGCAQGRAGCAVIGVFVDGTEHSEAGAEITVPHNIKELRFDVTPTSPRVRYKLEGLDPDWKERTDQMMFLFRFLNHEGDLISQEGFPVSGTSPGWQGSVAKSAFVARCEVVTVPPAAERMTVGMSSAGAPTLVGVYAVSGITVRAMDEDGKLAAVFLEDSRVPNSTAPLWGKSGTHPSMASAMNLEDGDTASPVLVIADDDVKAHADWFTGVQALPKVVPGQALKLRWNEAYSTGMGDPLSAVYERPPAATYRFVVENLSLAGVPLGSRSVVSVKVPTPYWRNVWFWLACAVFVSGLSIFSGRFLIRNRINRHLRQAQLIADERLRIARDLHDDLGTRLSHISLLGAYAESNSPDPDARASFGQITAMSRELIGALSETVWMLNPKNNQLETLVDYLCRLVSDLCRLAEIRCRIDAMSVTENVSITHAFRHNVSLAVKEIVNNALKHSSASEIRMTIIVEGRLLKITVVDNGVGMTPEARKSGLGLESISQRMKSVRGKCTMTPIDDGGLNISLEVPIL